MREDPQTWTHWPHMINKKEKIKVISRKPNLYISMQKGGFPIFKGLPSRKIRGAGFLGSVIGKIGFKRMAKLAAKKILPKIGKHVKEKIAPEILGAALESGKSVLSREKNLKQAMKSGIKKVKKNILNISKTVLKDKIARYQKGGTLMATKQKNSRTKPRGIYM